MDAPRRLFSRINSQMGDLTASQRLVIILCAVLVVGSFFWLVRWSAEPEWVRLLEEPMTTEQLAVVRQMLPAGKFKIVGDSILVAPADRYDLYWMLQGAGALPADTSTTFAKLIADDSPFRPESENDFRRRVALQTELAKVIASSNLVRSAEVFIADTSKRRLGGGNTVPTASVTVAMNPGKTLDESMVEACAAIVAGAVPGLDPHLVEIIDGATMRRFTVPDPENAFGQGLLRERQRHEEHLREKILDQLQYIHGVRVSVSVELDASRSQKVSRVYTKPEPLEEQTSLDESKTGSLSGEPGVGPNVGQAISTGGGAAVDTKEQSTTKFQPQQLAEETTTQTLPFAPTRTTGSVSIPRSYLVQIIKSEGGGDAEPSADQVDQQFQKERTRVLGIVKTILMTRNDSDITVDYHYDVGVLPGGEALAATGVGGLGGDLGGFLGRHGPQAGLAVLALAGLFMMARISRRSAREASGPDRGKSPAGDARGEGESLLTRDTRPVGRVEPTDGGTLVGKEVDETILRTTKLGEQVSKMVEERPEAAARLVQRWVEKDG